MGDIGPMTWEYYLRGFSEPMFDPDGSPDIGPDLLPKHKPHFIESLGSTAIEGEA